MENHLPVSSESGNRHTELNWQVEGIHKMIRMCVLTWIKMKDR